MWCATSSCCLALSLWTSIAWPSPTGCLQLAWSPCLQPVTSGEEDRRPCPTLPCHPAECHRDTLLLSPISMSQGYQHSVLIESNNTISCPTSHRNQWWPWTRCRCTKHSRVLQVYVTVWLYLPPVTVKTRQNGLCDRGDWAQYCRSDSLPAMYKHRPLTHTCRPTHITLLWHCQLRKLSLSVLGQVRKLQQLEKP